MTVRKATAANYAGCEHGGQQEQQGPEQTTSALHPTPGKRHMRASHKGRGHLRERFAAGLEIFVAVRVFRLEKRLDVTDGENVVCLHGSSRAVQRLRCMLNGGAQTPMEITLVLCSRALRDPDSSSSRAYHLQEHAHAGKHPGGEPPQYFLDAHLHGPAPRKHSAQTGCPAVLPASCSCLQAGQIALWHRCQRCARALACVQGMHAALRTTGSVPNPPGVHPVPLHRYLPAVNLQGGERTQYTPSAKMMSLFAPGAQRASKTECRHATVNSGPPQSVHGAGDGRHAPEMRW